MQDIQTNKQSNEEIREKAARKIYDIKQKAKQDIEEVKYNMHLELLVGNPRAIDRACKKENRRRYREAKREFCILCLRCITRLPLHGQKAFFPYSTMHRFTCS